MKIASKTLAAAAVAVFTLWTSPAFGQTPRRSLPAASEIRFDTTLLSEALRASGIEDPARRARYGASFRSELVRLREQIGETRSRYRQARRLFQALHGNLLRRYEGTADGIDAILDRGEFNCLSASLFYGIAAQAFGFEVQIVEIPRHVYVRIQIEGRRVEIETTSSSGFDFRQKVGGPGAPAQTSWYGAEDGTGEGDLAASLPGVDDLATMVELEAAVAYLWHNTGKRALDRGEALRAAGDFLEESRLLPSLASRSEVLSTFLARAFRVEYEAGRFDAAYRIAEIDLEIFSGKTSPRDRLLAAALKRIEGTCENGNPIAAERILDLAGAASRHPRDLLRLERGACPLIAATAVRVGDWETARKMAARFAAAQPDGVESARLSAWIERRRSEATSAAKDAFCAEPRPSELFVGLAAPVGGD